MIWKLALEQGRCPLARCDIRTATCKHLDRYLTMGTTKEYFEPGIDAYGTARIEEFEGEKLSNSTVGVWELFKKLRQLPLSSTHIKILLRTEALGMSRKHTMRELGWNSVREYQERLYEARKILEDSWK